MGKKVSLTILLISMVAVMTIGTNAMAATIGLSAVDSGLVNPGGEVEIPDSDVGTGFTFDVELSLELDRDIIGNGIVGFTVDVMSDDLVRINGYADGDDRYAFFDSGIENGNLAEIDGYNFGAGITDNHLLGTLTLECMGLGVTELVVKGRFVEDQNVALEDGSFLPTVFGSLVIKQGVVVPIPGSSLLLGAGILGLIGIRRRMR